MNVEFNKKILNIFRLRQEQCVWSAHDLNPQKEVTITKVLHGKLSEKEMNKVI